MEESIIIRNFGPIQEVKIDNIKPLTIFIGESGSGKSTIMKVIALFQWLYKMMCIRSFLKYSNINKSPFRFQFKSYIRNNGLAGYVKPNTEIVYRHGSTEIVFLNKKLKGTDRLVKKEELCLEKVVFISDKRNLIANILDNQVSPKRMFYLQDTHDNYIEATDLVKTFHIDFLNADFEIRKTPQGIKHVVVSKDEQTPFSAKLNETSSGTQSVLPLHIIVEYYAKYYDLIKSMNTSILSYVSHGDNIMKFRPATNIGDFPYKLVNLFVEEPELSLFPNAQLQLMDFLVNRCFVTEHIDYDMHLMLATHSPYIVNYLNVLLNRNSTANAFLQGNNVAVYRVFDGHLQNLVQSDNENKQWFVDTSDLAEPMSDILTEYQSLNKNNII